MPQIVAFLTYKGEAGMTSFEPVLCKENSRNTIKIYKWPEQYLILVLLYK